MGDDDSGLGIGGFGVSRDYVWSLYEDRMQGWMAPLKESVQQKRGSTWESEEDAQNHAQKAVEMGKKDQAVDDAYMGVQMKIVRLAANYVETQQNPDRGLEGITDALKDLIREFHNPSTREAILLMIEDDYRDYVRDSFSEIGSMFWGIYDLSNRDMTDDAWFTLMLMAQIQNRSIEDVAESIDGADPEDVPEWVREAEAQSADGSD